MKIKILFTGGTIGSKVGNDGYISLDKQNPYKLLDMYQKSCQKNAQTFDIEEPFCILSENMNEEYLNRLILCIQKILEESEIEGIIITHGTDTLPYTAAVLSYIFGTECIPIVLVSSDFPLEDDRANGLVNFKYAVDFIQNGYGKGVFACYCNQEEFPLIHRGTRLLENVPYTAFVRSVKDSYYGKYKGNQYEKNSAYHFDCSSDCSSDCNSGIVSDKKCYKHMDIKEYELCKNTGEIMWLHSCVGMYYPDITEKTKAVLHDSYHSGTICISEGLKEFMNQAKIHKVPVFVTGIAGDEKNYETIKEYQNLGIWILSGISPVAAYCKLWLALSNKLNIEQVMESCIAEDIC